MELYLTNTFVFFWLHLLFFFYLVLTTMGEVLSAEEVEDLMAGALVDKDGLVNYEVFVRDLLA